MESNNNQNLIVTSDKSNSDISLSDSDLEFSSEINTTEAKAQKVIEILKKSNKKQTSLSTNSILLYDKYCQHSMQKAISYEDFTNEKPLTGRAKSYKDSWVEFEDYRKVKDSNVTFTEFLATSNGQSENNPHRIAAYTNYVKQNDVQQFLSLTDYLNNFPEDDLETNIAFGIYLNDRSIPNNEKVQYWTWKKTWLQVCKHTTQVVKDMNPLINETEFANKLSDENTNIS